MAATPVGMKRFYAMLGAVAVIGLGVLGYQLSRPATVSIPANVTVQPSDTAGFHGYVKGSDERAGRDHRVRRLSVPVLPDVRHAPDADDRGAADPDRAAALALPRLPAAAAPLLACRGPLGGLRRRAGQVLAQHERIYEGQPEWAEARDAAAIFRRYAQESGLDLGKYDACMSSGKYAGRIQASYEEGVRAGVELDAHAARRRPAVSGPVRLRCHHPPGRFARAARRQRQMIYRMGAALLSLVGLFVSAYLYLYKIGRIGTLACGTGGCETVQTEHVEPVRGCRGRADRGAGVRPAPRRRADRAPAAPLAERRWPVSLFTALAAGGVLFTAYLTYLELFVIHAICRWCVGSAAIIVDPADAGSPRPPPHPGASGSLTCPRQSRRPPTGRALATLALGALGIVYGDIGTSPLYALKECFRGAARLPGHAARTCSASSR